MEFRNNNNKKNIFLSLHLIKNPDILRVRLTAWNAPKTRLQRVTIDGQKTNFNCELPPINDDYGPKD